MAPIPDPEKGGLPYDASTPATATSDSLPQTKETGTTRVPSLYTASFHTNSDTSDPLSPLSHALTPDLSTPAERALREEAAGGGPLAAAQTRTSVGSSASRPPDFEVVFEPGDPENPQNWSLWYRAWVTFCVSYATWTVVLYSTSYTAAIPGVMGEFYDVSNSSIVTLGLTTYLMGLATGSVIVAPMSELYGRRPVYILCMAIFTLLIIPCGLATSLTEIIVVRFFGALFGAAMVSNSPGTVVDISHPDYLALCMSLWSIAPLNGPVTGPLIGGFVYQYMGWRWTNYISLILGGVAALLILTVRETYAPSILQRKAARIRKESDDDRWWCRYDNKISTIDLLKLNLSRPFVLAATEPILWFFNIWISTVYGILYLCFVAYPIVFVQYRGWSPSLTGLSFIGMGIGTLLAIFCEPLWRRIINSHPRDPETNRAFPEATASVMIIGAIMVPIGQLVFSWTCLPAERFHWAIPIAFGIPFGMGNTIVFIYASNYLAAAYGIYAASALAGNAVMRSIFGAVLPLAGPSMYAALTPQWAGTLLGLMEVVLIPIPILFYKYGDRIRAKSRIIRSMREDQAKNEGRMAKQAARVARRTERAGVAEKLVAEEQAQSVDNGAALKSGALPTV
ncbi:major facilitator superfamily transporter [Lasiosphaeris hirsuta]|uniref:Major facilitator superfamily transporter n=1 Tax=Lasiosphaeris hirsuta TaxID=260670 RepID=A0AA40B0D9_9PEZI|nr:major facilitator superfamily transporter [Lasiosphaeris hirsuta]